MGHIFLTVALTVTVEVLVDVATIPEVRVLVQVVVAKLHATS